MDLVEEILRQKKQLTRDLNDISCKQSLAMNHLLLACGTRFIENLL